jgi:MoaA/NifB/PqqE/SkfB family radical SAM enzyme
MSFNHTITTIIYCWQPRSFPVFYLCSFSFTEEMPSPAIKSTLAWAQRCRRRRFAIHWPDFRAAVRRRCEGFKGECRRENRHRSDVWRVVDGFDVRAGRYWRFRICRRYRLNGDLRECWWPCWARAWFQSDPAVSLSHDLNKLLLINNLTRLGLAI